MSLHVLFSFALGSPPYTWRTYLLYDSSRFQRKAVCAAKRWNAVRQIIPICCTKARAINPTQFISVALRKLQLWRCHPLMFTPPVGARRPINMPVFYIIHILSALFFNMRWSWCAHTVHRGANIKVFHVFRIRANHWSSHWSISGLTSSSVWKG